MSRPQTAGGRMSRAVEALERDLCAVPFSPDRETFASNLSLAGGAGVTSEGSTVITAEPCVLFPSAALGVFRCWPTDAATRATMHNTMRAIGPPTLRPILTTK